MFRKNYHLQTYNRDENGAFQIRVALDKYEDIYDDWDPAPFRRRDIEENFIEYIWESALDIPIREKIIVLFLMNAEVRNAKKEEQLTRALNNHFTYLLRKSERAYLMEQAESLRYFILGIILVVLAYSDFFGSVNLWVKIFEEGVTVGAWVLLWEAFSNLFIECRSIRQEQKIIKRFLQTRYIFKDN